MSRRLTYYACHTVINEAFDGLPGFIAIDSAFVHVYHDEHAKPYLSHLIERIQERLEVSPLMNAFSSLFDANGPVLGENGDPLSLVSDYTDVDGLPEEEMREIVNTFVQNKNRKLAFCRFEEYVEVRDWVENWKKSLMD